ncbi:MAG: hypothetical protein HOO67_00775 [Candidatus Peribacteraceae bacterium]|nr:hypothetical protein [Candidatus Peribacteraceae bacterium]
MRKTFLTFLLLCLVIPATSFAYGKRPVRGTRTMTRGSTTGIFIDKQVWLPGVWTVDQKAEEVTFKKKYRDGVHESIVNIHMMPRDQCAYGLIRIRAWKAWGGRFLEQSQARIQPISFGTSKYKGYTWVEPSTWGGDQHWCVAQDLKNAMELTAPVGDAELMTFVIDDLLPQLAVRSGRSVLPWPAASGKSSSASSSSSSY